MNDGPEEIPEQEFLDRLRQRDVNASRHQLRHLKRKGQIRGAVQRRVPGQRGSLSMYLASEVDRVAAILTAVVKGRRTIERASKAAWLQQGEAALPAGMTLRSYIVSAIEQKRDELAADPRGEEFLEFVRDPIDPEADADGVQSEKGFNLAEEMISSNQKSPELPLIELAVHALLIRNYAVDSELAEVESVANVLGVISTPQGNREAWGESEFRQPVAQIFLNPSEYLADVSDETIEHARKIAVQFLESLHAFKNLPERLKGLKQPTGPNEESLATLGTLFSGRLATDPAFAVAYLAKKLSVGGESTEQFLRRLNVLTATLAKLCNVEELVAADPSVLKRLEELGAARRKKP